jgi:Holliday junction resolvase RusA-like endonuclease
VSELSRKISFFVAGIPKAMQTGSIVRSKSGQAFPMRRHSSWGSTVGEVARRHAPAVPFLGPVALTLTFLMPRPKTARRRQHPVVRPDVDNLVKGMPDSLNGVFWADDCQVVELHAAKRYDPQGRLGVEVVVEDLDGPEVLDQRVGRP